VHWLTWHDIWLITRSRKDLFATGIAVLTAIYYGPRKVLETWDWYVNRFLDEPVLKVLRDRRLIHASVLTNFGQPNAPREIPYGEPELAETLERTRQSVGKSLYRLRGRGKVEIYKGGWRITT